MPYVKRKRNTRRKARVTKRRSNRSVIARNPIPLKNIVKMRYSTTIRLDSSTGTSAYHLFRAGSIFDPDYTGIGHQPYGHDLYEQIYNHYKVLSSKISCTFLPNGSVSSGNAVCGVAIKDDTTVETNFDTIREAKGAHYKIARGPEGKATVTNAYNSSKMYDKTVNLTSAFGNGPVEDAYFQVFTTSVNTLQDGTNVDVLVTIDYVVSMWELKDLGQS